MILYIVTSSATRGQQIVAALQAVGQGEANLMQITSVPERESVGEHMLRLTEECAVLTSLCYPFFD